MLAGSSSGSWCVLIVAAVVVVWRNVNRTTIIQQPKKIIITFHAKISYLQMDGNHAQFFFSISLFRKNYLKKLSFRYLANLLKDNEIKFQNILKITGGHIGVLVGWVNGGV